MTIEHTPLGMESALSRVGLTAKEERNLPGFGLTEPQHRFLHWLAERSGTGLITKSNDFLAQGDLIRTGGRKFWQAFFELHMVDRDGPRLTLNEQGHAYVKTFPLARPSVTLRHKGQIARHPGLDQEDE